MGSKQKRRLRVLSTAFFTHREFFQKSTKAASAGWYSWAKMQVTVIILADFIVKLGAFCGVLDILLGALCNQHVFTHAASL